MSALRLAGDRPADAPSQRDAPPARSAQNTGSSFASQADSPAFVYDVRALAVVPTTTTAKGGFLSRVFGRSQGTDKQAQAAAGTSRPSRPAVISDVIPGSFKHEGHIGITDDGNVDVRLSSVPPEWKQYLRALGVSRKALERDPQLATALLGVLADAPAVTAGKARAQSMGGGSGLSAASAPAPATTLQAGQTAAERWAAVGRKAATVGGAGSAGIPATGSPISNAPVSSGAGPVGSPLTAPAVAVSGARPLPARTASTVVRRAPPPPAPSTVYPQPPLPQHVAAEVDQVAAARASAVAFVPSAISVGGGDDSASGALLFAAPQFKALKGLPPTLTGASALALPQAGVVVAATAARAAAPLGAAQSGASAASRALPPRGSPAPAAAAVWSRADEGITPPVQRHLPPRQFEAPGLSAPLSPAGSASDLAARSGASPGQMERPLQPPAPPPRRHNPVSPPVPATSASSGAPAAADRALLPPTRSANGADSGAATKRPSLLAEIQGFSRSSLSSAGITAPEGTGGSAAAGSAATGSSATTAPSSPPPGSADGALLDRLRAVMAATRTVHAAPTAAGGGADSDDDDGWGSD